MAHTAVLINGTTRPTWAFADISLIEVFVNFYKTKKTHTLKQQKEIKEQVVVDTHIKRIGDYSKQMFYG